MPDARAIAAKMPRTWGLVLRHYEVQNRSQLAQDIARICRARRVLLLVAGDWRLACSVGADGVHMPERQLRTEATAPLLHACRSKILTVSAHGPEGLHHAKSIGANGVFLSPVNATRSHANATPLGALPFAALASSYGLLTYALGGVGLKERPRLEALGAAGIAGISLALEEA